MKKGVGILRVSTQHQDYDYQAGIINKNAKFRNIELVKVFEEKISGRKRNRKSIKELFNYIDENNGAIDFVIVSELSRIGRTFEVLQVVEKLTNKGISLISDKEGIETLDKNGELTATTKLYINILQSINEFESSTTEYRTTEGVNNAVIKNNIWIGGRPPYGYRVEDKKLIVDEDEAKIVNKIFQLYTIEGYGSTKISDYLKKNEIASKYGGAWNYATIKKILSNEIYIGVRLFNRNNKKMQTIKIEDEDLRIITDEAFNDAQNRVHRNHNYPKISKKYSYLFDNRIIKCGCCGKHFVVISADKGKNAKYACYQNKGYKYCINTQQRVDYIDFVINKILIFGMQKLLKDNSQEIANKDKIENEIELLLIEKKKNNEKLKRIKTLFIDLMIDKDEYVERNSTIKDYVDKIDNNISTLKSKLNNLNSFEVNISKISVETDVKEDARVSKDTLHKVIENIVVDLDEIYVKLINGNYFVFPKHSKGWVQHTNRFDKIRNNILTILSFEDEVNGNKSNNFSFFNVANDDYKFDYKKVKNRIKEFDKIIS